MRAAGDVRATSDAADVNGAAADAGAGSVSIDAQEVPSLADLLAARGIHKSAAFDDYQDYIKERQQQGVKAKVVDLPRVYAQGSMHLALGYTGSVDDFWTKEDRR